MDNSGYGQKSTFSASDSTLKINIEDQVAKYPDWQFPIVKRWNSAVFRSAVKSHKYEWTERELRPVTAKVASATVASGATTFYVDTPGVFNVDDLLQKPDGEVVVVTQVAGGTLLTVKAWSGTPEEMVLGETVRRLAPAAPQGKNADNMVHVGTTDLYNYTGIYEDVVDLSGTQHRAMIHGDQTSAELIAEKQKELLESLQNTAIVGVRAKDTSEKRTTAGGLKFFIDTYASANVVDFGGSWATDATVIGKFEDAVEKIAQNNGSKPTIYMGYAAMRKFRMINDDVMRTQATEKAKGVAVATTYMSQLGNLDVVMVNDRFGAFRDAIYFVDETKVGYKAMNKRGWFTEYLAKLGDSHRWQVLGEYTFKFENPKCMSYLTNLGL